MNMVPFKDEKDLDARLAAYKGSVNNDYMNRRRYVEELEELRYFDDGDLYIGTKNNDRWHVTYYLKEQKPLDLDEALVTEIVGRRPDTSAAEAVGFRLYKMRLRLRLKEGLEISPRVATLDDGDFVARGIAAFDPVSGNHQSTDEIQRDVREGRVIGIPEAGFAVFRKPDGADHRAFVCGAFSPRQGPGPRAGEALRGRLHRKKAGHGVDRRRGRSRGFVREGGLSKRRLSLGGHGLRTGIEITGG